MWRIAPYVAPFVLGAACHAQPDEAGRAADPAASVAWAPAAELTQAVTSQQSAGRTPSRPARPALLLPADPQLRRAAQVMWTGDRYTALVKHGGASIQITGAKLSGRAAPLLVQRTEYGLDASFGRDGGVYNITLACDAPADRRCADESYVRQLAASLTPA